MPINSKLFGFIGAGCVARRSNRVNLKGHFVCNILKWPTTVATANAAAVTDKPPSGSTTLTAPPCGQLDGFVEVKDVTNSNNRWNDWRWQMSHRIRTLAQLGQYFPALRGQTELEQVAQKYPVAITPYYASLIRKADPSDPVYRDGRSADLSN